MRQEEKHCKKPRGSACRLFLSTWAPVKVHMSQSIIHKKLFGFDVKAQWKQAKWPPSKRAGHTLTTLQPISPVCQPSITSTADILFLYVAFRNKPSVCRKYGSHFCLCNLE